MFKYILITVFQLVLIVVSPLLSDDLVKRGTTAASFLQIGLGARAAGLGGAYVSLADDPSALYWNPAGITKNRNFSISYYHNDLYAGISNQALGLVYSLSEQNHLGVLINTMDIGSMEITTLDEPDGTGEQFDAANLSASLTYARQLTDQVSFGISAKYIQERIWLEIARGFALDLGTVYELREYQLKIGMSLTNLGTDIGISEAPHLLFYREKQDEYPGSPQPESQLSTKAFALPLTFIMGLSINVLGQQALLVSEEHRLTPAFSINDAFNAPLRTNAGIEYSWKETLAFRAGYYMGYDAAGLSAGFGINLHRYTALNLALNYGWVDYADLGTMNIWELEFRIK